MECSICGKPISEFTAPNGGREFHHECSLPDREPLGKGHFQVVSRPVEDKPEKLGDPEE